MIAETGLIFLWIAAALAVLQFGLGWIATQKDDPELLRGVRAIAIAQGFLAIASFSMLVWLFLRSDMSVQLVAANSHSVKPLLYKFAGTWGNHEGSMLLWVTILAAAGAAVALFEKSLKVMTMSATLADRTIRKPLPPMSHPMTRSVSG